jgi:hypothetical protein
MIIPAIFRTPRIKKGEPRSRRARGGLRLQFEHLEIRTSLSTGLEAVPGAPVVLRAAEIGRIGTGTPLFIAGTSLAISTFDQMFAFGLSASAGGAGDGSPTLTVEPAAAPLSVFKEFITSGPNGDAILPTTGTFAADPVALGSTQASSGAAAGPRVDFLALERIASDGTITAGSAADPFAIDGGNEDGPPPGVPWPFLAALMGAVPGRGASQSTSDDEPDTSSAGPLPFIESTDGLVLGTVMPVAAGHASGVVSSLAVQGPPQPIDSNGVAALASGLSYLAAGEGATRLAEPAAFSGMDPESGDESSTEPVSPTSMAAGGVPLSVLLSGPVVPSETQAGDLEQVAELIPLPQSSLALAAALWTVPADAQRSRPGWDRSWDVATDPAVPAAYPASWMVFLTGMDQAFEQSMRDLREDTVSRNESPLENAGPSGGSDELIEWQRPILPAAAPALPAIDSESPRPDRVISLVEGSESLGTAARQPTRADLPADGGLSTQETAWPQSRKRPPMVLGATSMLSLVSFATAAVGWLWRERKRARRLGLGRRGAVTRQGG